MTFPLPPREAAVLDEFVRLLDARLVAEGAAGESSSEPSASPPDAGTPSVTEPLFPTEEAA